MINKFIKKIWKSDETKIYGLGHLRKHPKNKNPLHIKLPLYSRYRYTEINYPTGPIFELDNFPVKNNPMPNFWTK